VADHSLSPATRKLIERLAAALRAYDDADPYHEHRYLLAGADAALAQPEAVGPSGEELTLFAVEWWRSFTYLECGADDETPINEIIHSWHFVDFLKDALSRWGRPAITPIPVSERLPEEGDCDAEGRCWLGYPTFTYSLNGEHDTTNPEWDLEPLPSHKPDWSNLYWLPHWALPVPQQKGND
jgi:hypothetical protein